MLNSAYCPYLCILVGPTIIQPPVRLLQRSFVVYGQRCDFSGLFEGILAQMCISLGRGYVGVSEQLLDLVQAAPGIDKEACEVVPQIMDSEVRKSCIGADFIPCGVEIRNWLSCFWAWKNIRAFLSFSP